MSNLLLLTPNLLHVTRAEADGARPEDIILYGDVRYAYFRGAEQASEQSIYVREGVGLSDLSSEDVLIINDRCENTEYNKNREVRQDIGSCLRRHFDDRAFHVYELGCGKRAIEEQLPPNASYHGIDCDARSIEALHAMDISASDWAGIDPGRVPANKPSVCVGVYSLHFLANTQLPQRIADLTDPQEGFFIGNFYVNHEERKTSGGRRRLCNILNQNDMWFKVIDDVERNYEYWVVGRPYGQKRVIQDPAYYLTKTIEAHGGRPYLSKKFACELV